MENGKEKINRVQCRYDQMRHYGPSSILRCKFSYFISCKRLYIRARTINNDMANKKKKNVLSHIG